MPIKRRKLFYPKSDKILGLLTKGKEWMLYETKEEYKGPYHRFTDGVVMTGGAPSKRSKYLVPYKNMGEPGAVASEIYREITKVKVDKFIAPSYFFPKVREKDFATGYIDRYFVQQTNDRNRGTIVEIEKDSYGKVAKNNKKAINGNIYVKFQLRWKITGTEEEIEEINRTTLVRLNRQYPGIREYLGDLTELSKFSPIITE
tara:strand:- start:331 stop:936 length:606 start_codon:yes stop_codon:yes gene_type:complete